MLVYDPEKRASAEALLTHAFFQEKSIAATSVQTSSVAMLEGTVPGCVAAPSILSTRSFSDTEESEIDTDDLSLRKSAKLLHPV